MRRRDLLACCNRVHGMVFFSLHHTLRNASVYILLYILCILKQNYILRENERSHSEPRSSIGVSSYNFVFTFLFFFFFLFSLPRTYVHMSNVNLGRAAWTMPPIHSWTGYVYDSDNFLWCVSSHRLRRSGDLMLIRGKFVFSFKDIQHDIGQCRE